MLAQAQQNPDTKYDILATLVQVGATQFTQNQKAYQAATLHDGQTQATVRIYQGNSCALGPIEIGQRLNFTIQGYRGKNGVLLSGFWKNQATVNQNQPARQYNQPAPQPAAPVPPAAPQAAPVVQKGIVDTIPHVPRECAVKQAVALCVGSVIKVDEIPMWAEKFAYFILNGKFGEKIEADSFYSPAADGTEPPPMEDEIPF